MQTSSNEITTNYTRHSTSKFYQQSLHNVFDLDDTMATFLMMSETDVLASTSLHCPRHRPTKTKNKKSEDLLFW